MLQRTCIAEIKVAEETVSTVPRAVALGVIRDEYAAVRARFANFGNAIASRTAPITDPAEVQEVADELVRENLGSLVGELPDA